MFYLILFSLSFFFFFLRPSLVRLGHRRAANRFFYKTKKTTPVVNDTNEKKETCETRGKKIFIHFSRIESETSLSFSRSYVAWSTKKRFPAVEKDWEVYFSLSITIFLSSSCLMNRSLGFLRSIIYPRGTINRWFFLKEFLFNRLTAEFNFRKFFKSTNDDYIHIKWPANVPTINLTRNKTRKSYIFIR